MKNLLIILLLGLIISCDDDDSNSENVPEDGIRTYIEGQAGSYWYYETYADNQSGNDSLVAIDSIVVEQQLDYEGRSAIQCRRFTRLPENSNYEDAGTFYLSTSPDQLWAHSNGFLNLFSGNIPFGDPADFFDLDPEWILLADKNQSRWDAFETDVEFGFIFFDVTGTTEAKGRRISTSEIEKINGWNYIVDEYDLNVENRLEIEFGAGVPAPVDFELDYTVKYADKLGIYSIYTISSEVNIPGQELPETPPTEQRLIRTNVGN